MKTKIAKTISAASTFLLLTVPMFVLAQIANPLKGTTSISGFITTVLGYVVKIGGVVAIFAFIWSGFKFVQAQGNEKELGEAKNIFINTCIGVAILLGAQLISSIIVGTLKSLS